MGAIIIAMCLFLWDGVLLCFTGWSPTSRLKWSSDLNYLSSWLPEVHHSAWLRCVFLSGEILTTGRLHLRSRNGLQRRERLSLRQRSYKRQEESDSAETIVDKMNVPFLPGLPTKSQAILSEASIFLIKWRQGHLLGGGGVKRAERQSRVEKPAGILRRFTSRLGHLSRVAT